MNRVDGCLALSRAFGDYGLKDNPDLPPTEQKVIALPVLTKVTARRGDVLLLCCDGITEILSLEQVEQSPLSK